MAYTFEYYPKSDTRRRGLAYLRGTPGSRTIVIVHGIDERGDESRLALQKVAMWGGWLNIVAIAVKYKFNIIWVQDSENDTTDSIDYAIEMAQTDLGTPKNKIHLLGYSWGGRRIRIWVSRNLQGAQEIASVMRVSSGGAEVDDWTNTVAAKLPTWIMHAVDDKRTSFTNSLVSFANAMRLDPTAPVYYTEFIAGLDLTFGGHNMLKYVGEWQIAAPTRTKATAGYISNSKLNVPQWWEMNEWRRPTSPNDTYQAPPVVPGEPEPIPAPVVKKQIAILYEDSNGVRSWEYVK
jgi:hypothetical protein